MQCSKQFQYKKGVVFLFAVLLFMMGPMNAVSIEPSYRAGFNESDLSQSGWTASPAGFGEFQQAATSIGLIPSSPTHPTYTDGRGLIITAVSGQGSFVFGPTIPVTEGLVVMRVSILSQNAGGSIAMGALDVIPNGTLAQSDGSLSYSLETNSQRYLNEYQQITVLYRPKSSAIIPFLQLAVFPSANPQSVTVMFDNFEVYPLTANTVGDPELQTVFGLSQGGISPTPTPSPTPTSGGGSELVGDIYSISSGSDNQDAIEPAVDYDRDGTYSVVAADRTSGFQDIVMHNFDVMDETLSDPITVNETFEDTEAQQPDIDIDFGGTRHVAWSDNRSIEKLFSIYLSEFGPFGDRLLPSSVSDAELNLLYEDTNAYDPAISVNDAGNMIVVWRDDRNFLFDLFGRRLRWTDNAVEFLDTTDIQINVPFEDTEITKGLDVAMDEFGNVLAVWSDNRVLLDQASNQKRDDIYGRLFTMSTSIVEGHLPDPAQLPEINVSDFDNYEDYASNPRVAYSNDHFVVVWQNRFPAIDSLPESSHIHATVINMQGQIVHPEFVIDSGDDNHFAVNPSISVWSDNEFMITWWDQADNAIFARWYDPHEHVYVTDPIILGNEIEVWSKTGAASGDENNLLVVWDEFFNNTIDIFAFAGFWTDQTTSFQTTPMSISRLRAKAATRTPVSITTQEIAREPKTKATRDQEHKAKR